MNASEICKTAEYLANNVHLHVMLIIRVVSAVSGVFLLYVLVRAQGTYPMFHANARALMISHHIWIVVLCATEFGVHMINLVRYAHENSDPCQFVISTLAAALIRGPSVFATYGQVWSLASMAVERLFATIRYRDYERQGRGIDIWLVLIQWLLASLWIWIAVRGLNFSDLKAYTTVSSSTNSATFSNLLIALAVIEVISICIFCGLLWYNRRIKTQLNLAPLTEKYQIRENIRSTQLMIPMILTHFCVFMPTLTAFPLYMKINPSLDPKDYTVFLETFLTVPFYSVCLPVVLFWRHKALRQNLQKVLGVNEVSPDAPRNHLHLHHFAMLKDMWEK